MARQATAALPPPRRSERARDAKNDLDRRTNARLDRTRDPDLRVPPVLLRRGGLGCAGDGALGADAVRAPDVAHSLRPRVMARARVPLRLSRRRRRRLSPDRGAKLDRAPADRRLAAGRTGGAVARGARGCDLFGGVAGAAGGG